MKINCSETDKGIKFSVNDRAYFLEYPDDVWRQYPDSMKKVMVDNYAFLKSLHLPQMLNNGNSLEFDTSYPLFKKPLYNAMLNNISFCADVDSISTEKNIKKFMNLNFSFKDFKIDYPKYEKKLEEKSVLNMSFGKDSLLTFALADELGLDPKLVFMEDNSVKLENEYKRELIKKFSKELNTGVETFSNGTGVIHDYRHWSMPRTEWGYGHMMTELLLDIMPFAHKYSSKYILFGNEKSCDETYINKDGYISYPVFDQSSDWMIEMSKIANSLTNNQARVVSLIEPLYELAITKILHKRYPHIGKFQMSCFPDENEYGKQNYWCEHCSKCARIFIFLKANGIDPKTVGFKTNMLEHDKEHLYSCFGLEKKEGFSVGYDSSGMARDEQLYSFFLAYKRGVKGELIDRFKENLLEEARVREDKLHNKFMAIHPSKTIPEKFMNPLHSIFKEELSKD
jgi:hypothetical protein